MSDKKQRRVLLVTQYFYPENFVINDLAFELAKKGYKVDALVSVPNYPEGEYFKGYGLFRKRFETIKGVRVYRAFQIPRGKKGGNIRLSLTYISYMVSATLWSLFLSLFKTYDSIIVFQMSPITQAVPAIVLGCLRKIPVYTWVLDIWPDSATSTLSGKLKTFVNNPLSRITEFVYKHSHKILISSKGMADLVSRKHDFSAKIQYMPNWAKDFSVKEKSSLPSLPEGFKIMMAGNLGEGIGVEDVIACVEALSDLKDLHFIFLGGGSKQQYLKEYFQHNENVHVLGRYPAEAMPSFFSQADAMFLSLQKTEYEFLEVTVPARLQAYMSASKPVFAMIGSGATEIIKEADCGFAVPSGDSKALADVIRKFYQDEELLLLKGMNGRSYYEKEFTLDQGIKRFEKLIEETI